MPWAEEEGGRRLHVMIVDSFDASALSPPAFTPQRLFYAGRKFATV